MPRSASCAARFVGTAERCFAVVKHVGSWSHLWHQNGSGNCEHVQVQVRKKVILKQVVSIVLRQVGPRFSIPF